MLKYELIYIGEANGRNLCETNDFNNADNRHLFLLLPECDFKVKKAEDVRVFQV